MKGLRQLAWGIGAIAVAMLGVGAAGASGLVQLGLLDPKALPVVGPEGARKVLNPKQP